MIDVILPVLNAGEFLEICLKSFKKYVKTDYQIIVVDGGSTDNTLQIIDMYTKQCNIAKVLRQDKRGCAVAYNTALKHCSSEYVLLLTADVLLCSDALTPLVKMLDEDKNIAIVTPLLLYPNDSVQYAGIGFDDYCEPYHVGRFRKAKEFTVVKEFPSVSLTFALMRRNSLVPFDEEYVYNYEDIDMTLKLYFKKYKLLMTPKSKVYHFEGSTILRIPDFPNLRTQSAIRFHSLWDKTIIEEKSHDKEFWTEGREYV